MFKLMLLIVIIFFPVPGATPSVFAQAKASANGKTDEQPPTRYQAEGGVPKDKAAEKRRDYAVLETALNDLTSPQNPEYKYHIKSGGPGREIVVNYKTYKYDVVIDLDDESCNIDNKDPRRIPADMVADFNRRNAEPRRSLADFRPANRNILVRNLDKLFEKRVDSLEEFLKRCPTAWGYVWAYSPGYSRDGQRAFVLFEGGPNGIHGLNWLYVLVKKGKRWEIEWRHLHPRE